MDGLRDPRRHAACAYLASLQSTHDLCKRIYQDYDKEPEADHGRFKEALDIYNGQVAPENRISPDEQVPSQRRLSQAVDSRHKADLLRAEDTYFQAHGGLVSAPGASTCCMANLRPASDEEGFDSATFRVALLRRVRDRVFPEDGPCPH